MNIHTQVSSNKLHSWLILTIFIFLITGFFYLVGLYTGSSVEYFFIGVIFSLLTSGVTYFYSDKIILFTVNAIPASKKQFFDLYTVTENIAIASGLPMPRLYVIEDESPNAFATGRNPKNSVICVTTGLLSKLERSELEGVISHELSHIKNYDILLSSVVSVLIGTIALISDWLMRSLWWGGLKKNDEEKENNNPLLTFLFIFALIITPIIGTLIQLALSRKREFLADADGALLSRNPDALARALEKIAQDRTPLRSATTSTAHLFISNPLKKQRLANWLINLFNTHPPIEERIKILRSM